MSEPWAPHAYQRRSVKHLVSHGAVGLFADPGLGKTSVVLAALKVLLRQKLVRSALVVAPLRVCRLVWPAERDKWTDFADLRVARAAAPADVYALNPEGLEWYLDALASGEVAKLPDVLVLDESTLFKNKDSQRFKRLQVFVAKFRRRYALTGTPAPNSLLDLWGQVYMLDLGASLGGLFYAFRRRYFYEDVATGNWLPKEGAEEAIYQRLGPLALRLDERDYLDVPACRTQVVEVELPPKARAAYEKFERDLIAHLEDGTITAANAAGATTKVRQIASGAAYDEDRRVLAVHGAKYQACLEVVAELQGRPLLVFYEFLHERDALAARLEPGTWAEIGPKVGEAEEREVQRRFDRGDLRVLFAHPQSAGYGLNLQAACAHEFWTSGTWKPEGYAQGVKRVHRQGQTRPVTIFRCVARGTIDSLVWLRIDQKGARQQRLLDALNSYYKVKPRRNSS